jgi:hypothetical protein
MAGRVPSRREAKKPKKTKKPKATLESLSEAPMPSVEVIKPKRKPRAVEEEQE